MGSGSNWVLAGGMAGVAACSSSTFVEDPVRDASVTTVIGTDGSLSVDSQGWEVGVEAGVARDAHVDAPEVKPGCLPGLSRIPDGPNYAPFQPVLGSHCHGTNHQQIASVEKVVFLGDSVTAGTPPTLPHQFYSTLVAANLIARFGLVEVANCARWGAHTSDLLSDKGEIAHCFPSGVESKRTLIVMTVGGNDISTWASKNLSVPEAMVQADAAAQALRDAVVWLKDPVHFPNGSYVIFGNVYEYTDATGDLLSCPTAALSGLQGNWLQGKPAVVHLQEQFMRVAVDTQTDMMFLLEAFCGHGFRHRDPASPCYLGPSASRWFDLTCIHPTPEGHAAIADLVNDIVRE